MDLRGSGRRRLAVSSLCPGDTHTARALRVRAIPRLEVKATADLCATWAPPSASLGLRVILSGPGAQVKILGVIHVSVCLCPSLYLFPPPSPPPTSANPEGSTFKIHLESTNFSPRPRSYPGLAPSALTWTGAVPSALIFQLPLSPHYRLFPYTVARGQP